MKITENIYKISGVEYGTNSNTYAVRAGGELVLIDAGYSQLQWDVMMDSLKRWNLDMLPVTYIFVTHSHFDHAGNVHLAESLGAKVVAGPGDAEKIMSGNPEMEELFHTRFITGQVDEIAGDGDVYTFDNAVIHVMHTPGHSDGSLSFLIETDGISALCTGDMFMIKPDPPQDDVQVELGYQGCSDFDKYKFIESLRRVSEMQVDILLPGHYYCCLNNVRRVTEMAYQIAVDTLT